MANPVWINDDVVIAKLRSLPEKLRPLLNKSMDDASKFLQLKIRENITLSDHSLTDLRNMGHPYSKRRPSAIHSPPWLIHTQSGRLARSLEYEDRKDKKNVVFRVGFNQKIAPHAKYVLLGTSRMVGRDVLNGTLNQYQKEIMQKISDIKVVL